eukprot:Plantae.Rhodophyta-Rhodochaete_pulchella.ctg2705.p2 GENE.Plantae.Rhodophyta-Rhodochaete_pulchella.ctg2705~~Plantae.Rhodophyta-Rhodochaete_pulchella.ctg2705.p2  ORF type:complete len:264 (+),score=49.15 Plantae.Rhodophyta-Rhodochaete_pulchella.ctg2705:52-792(+)
MDVAFHSGSLVGFNGRCSTGYKRTVCDVRKRASLWGVALYDARSLRALSRVSRMAATTAEQSGEDVKSDAEARMKKSVESTQNAFNTIRTGRANASILDRVVVSYYEIDTPLNQLASIAASSSTTLTIDPYDKSVIKDIERALMESDIGLTPNSDGNVIRLSIPPLTKERRQELVKQLKGLAEDGRVAIRNVRRDGVDKLKKLEKDGDLGKDQSKGLQDTMQKLTKKYIKVVDDAFAEKEKDIMKV